MKKLMVRYVNLDKYLCMTMSKKDIEKFREEIESVVKRLTSVESEVSKVKEEKTKLQSDLLQFLNYSRPDLGRTSTHGPTWLPIRGSFVFLYASLHLSTSE